MSWAQPSGPQATPPQANVESPPPTVPDGATTNQEERLLSACAYLTWIVGFWIVGPVAIYLLYREKSRYVAFHCIQAIVVSVGLTIIAPVFWILGLLLVFAVSLTGSDGPMPGVLVFGMYGVFILVLIVPMLWMLLGAYRAFQGQRWRVPLAWRVAKKFTQDDGQAPQQPSPFQNIYPGAKP